MCKQIKSYKLKIYANSNKLSELSKVLDNWKTNVQKFIDIFWCFESVKSTFPPKPYYANGTRLLNDASKKAWQTVKGAKKFKSEKPIYQASEIDLNSSTFRFIDPETKEFDFWIRVAGLTKYHRIAIPTKKTWILNEALKKGKLKNSCKIWASPKGVFYLQVYVEFESKQSHNSKLLGIDVGLTRPMATSDGHFYGDSNRSLRIRTKHRKYLNGLSAVKQDMNRQVKRLVSSYPDTDFVCEQLVFKGKKNSSKKFRRNKLNWPYKQTVKKLEQLAPLEGFKVWQVNPAYSSQTCPSCLKVDKGSRQGDCFKCTSCGLTANADTVGAINLLARVPSVYSEPLSVSSSS